MRYLLVSVSLALLLIPFFFGVSADAATWYNSSWLKARKIQTDPADFTADLTNYPVYVNITQVNIGTDSQADCDDFIFVDHYNTTVFPHEIETCDSTADWLEAWVKVPTAFNANATDIYMYYNNAGATDQQQTQATWNSNYKMVQHLNGTFVDSVSSPITCTNSGSSAASDVYIGDSKTWDGVDDYINCGSDAKVDDIFDGGGTISFWVRDNTDGENGSYLLNKGDGVGQGWTVFQIQDATLPTELTFRILFNTSPFLVDWTTNAEWMDAGKWIYLVITYNDDVSTNNPVIFVNGTSRAITQTNADTAYRTDAAEAICLGNAYDGTGGATCGTGSTHDGGLDEIRFNDSVLSGDWILADYECQKGARSGSDLGQSCITIGAEGTEPASGSTVTVTDEFALEDVVSIIAPGNVVVSDEYALEDSVSATANNLVNPTDEYAIEDSVSIPGSIVVTDEFALEDSAATNQIIVSDDFALEDSMTNFGTSSPIANAIVIYLNSPTATRLGGIYSGTCDFANNYTMVGVWTNGTIRCMKIN